MDVIIILGAVIGRDGHPGRVARFRLQHALPIMIETLPDSWVLISGGVLPGRPVSEARAMGDWAVSRPWNNGGKHRAGTWSKDCLPEEVSLNTADRLIIPPC